MLRMFVHTPKRGPAHRHMILQGVGEGVVLQQLTLNLRGGAAPPLPFEPRGRRYGGERSFGVRLEF